MASNLGKNRGVARPARDKPAPPKSGARLLFLILLLMFSGAIMATSLLANGQRNLRALLDRYGIDWLAVEAPGPRGTLPLAGRPVSPTATPMPTRLPAAAEPEAIGAFVREVRATGPELCAAFQSAGLANDGWMASQFDPKAHECLSETVFASSDRRAPDASFFLIAKGTADGEVNSIRMKLIAPQTENGERVLRLLMAALEQLIALTQWRDLAPAIEQVGRLEDATFVRFGLSFRFAHEFTAARSYNLVILPVSKSAAMARSRAYFAPGDWLDSPATARLPAFLLPHVVRLEASAAL